MKPILIALLVLATFAAVECANAAAAIPPIPETATLRFNNSFNGPTEVLEYYIARDQNGFVWTGAMTALEREEFTTWGAAPEAETTLVAENYSLRPEKVTPDHAIISVDYAITASLDKGGQMRREPTRKSVRFLLEKFGGQWKIVAPKAGTIQPVISAKLAASFVEDGS